MVMEYRIDECEHKLNEYGSVLILVSDPMWKEAIPDEISTVNHALEEW